MLRQIIRAALVTAFLTVTVGAAPLPPGVTREADVIYGRYPGVALTMDVFTPTENARHVGVVVMISGGWFSTHESIDGPFRAFIDPLTRRGYTVFAVVHGSQPKFTIPEILPMTSRAVRYIRYHARDFHIDPDHLGVCGGSAGGHLSLMQALHPVPPDLKSTDPVDHVSAGVQAVGCFFPPTDFLNWGKPGHDALGRNEFAWIRAPFDFHEFSPSAHAFVPITDEARIRQIGHDISPIYFVSPKSPPILIIHGDKDALVPIQQSHILMDALQKAGVACRLIVKPGLNHGWIGIDKDMDSIADWFDQYLTPGRSSKTATGPSTGPALQPSSPTRGGARRD